MKTKPLNRNDGSHYASSPIRVLREHLDHIEERIEFLEDDKRKTQEKLDSIMWDLNETCGFRQQILDCIKHLEGITKK